MDGSKQHLQDKDLVVKFVLNPIGDAPQQIYLAQVAH